MLTQGISREASDLPERMCHPDIMQIVLSHADQATLAICVRVSQSFFYMAGQLLYHELEVGSDARGRHPLLCATRDGRFKTRLLQHTRKITLYDSQNLLNGGNIWTGGLDKLEVCVRRWSPCASSQSKDSLTRSDMSALMTRVGPTRHYIERACSVPYVSPHSRKPPHRCQRATFVTGLWAPEKCEDDKSGIRLSTALSRTSCSTFTYVIVAFRDDIKQAMGGWRPFEKIGRRNDISYHYEYFESALRDIFSAVAGQIDAWPTRRGNHPNSVLRHRVDKKPGTAHTSKCSGPCGVIVGITREQWVDYTAHHRDKFHIACSNGYLPDTVVAFDKHVELLSMREWDARNEWHDVCTRQELNEWIAFAEDSKRCNHGALTS